MERRGGEGTNSETVWDVKMKEELAKLREEGSTSETFDRPCFSQLTGVVEVYMWDYLGQDPHTHVYVDPDMGDRAWSICEI